MFNTLTSCRAASSLCWFDGRILSTEVLLKFLKSGQIESQRQAKDVAGEIILHIFLSHSSKNLCWQVGCVCFFFQFLFGMPSSHDLGQLHHCR